MVDYFFVIFVMLSIYNIKINGPNNFFSDYMDIDNTNSIKGIFVWLIIFCHKTGYGNFKNYLFFGITQNLGQKVVSMFLFYSGFGIYESIKKSGYNYVKTLPIKGIILFIKSQLIILMFLATNIFIFKRKVSFRQYALSVIFKSGLGNSNWFAFTIIVLYLYSYVSFRFLKHKFFFGIIILSFLSFFHVKFVLNYYYQKQFYTVDTILCFLVGLFYSLCQKYFDKFLLKNDIYYYGIISIIIFLFYKTYNNYTLIKISMKNALFALLIISITIKVKFNNEFLKFLNSHSYSIYLLQRLVMWIVIKKRILQNHNFIQISFEFTSIIFISTLFDKYTFFVDKLLKKSYKKIPNRKYIIFNNININNQEKNIINFEN